MLMTHSFVPANDPRRSNPRAASIRLETRNASRLYYQRGHDLRAAGAAVGGRLGVWTEEPFLSELRTEAGMASRTICSQLVTPTVSAM